MTFAELERPFWTVKKVNAVQTLDGPGAVTFEQAISEYLDYYADTGDLLADPDDLKDKLRDICRDKWCKAHKIPERILDRATDADSLLVAIEDSYQKYK